MSAASVIAIDGPAGSGKTTLGRELAARLGYLYFDSGVLYRAVTWLALQRGVDVSDEAALVALAEQASIDVVPPTVADGRHYTVLVNGEDLTWAIRSPEVDANVSVVSSHPRLRQALLPVQRAIAARGRVVMVGRDIATVVHPQAELKVYLVASLDVRAERRRRDLVAQGHLPSVQAVRAEIKRRDEFDSRRAAAPLRAAPDAVIINTDTMSVAEEVAMVERLARQRGEDC